MISHKIGDSKDMTTDKRTNKKSLGSKIGEIAMEVGLFLIPFSAGAWGAYDIGHTSGHSAGYAKCERRYEDRVNSKVKQLEEDLTRMRDRREEWRDRYFDLRYRAKHNEKK